MDFRLPDEHEVLRREIQELIEHHVDHEVIDETHRNGTNHCAPLAQALGDAGILARAMPGAGTGDRCYLCSRPGPGSSGTKRTGRRLSRSTRSPTRVSRTSS